MTRRGAPPRATAAVLGVVALAWSVAVPVTGQGLPARQGVLSLDEGRLFYEIVGSGPPIVVIHGGPGLDHQYLRPGLDVLASAGQLVYYDQRGTGRSEAELDSASIGWDAFVDDVERLREALGHDRITVLGHSFGGFLALDYARRHPDRTRALILMNMPEPGQRWRTATGERLAAGRTEADAARLAELAATPGFEARDAATMSEYYRTSFRAIVRDPERLERVNLDLSGRTARNGPDVARLLGTSLGAIDWWDRLPGIDVPALVVHGLADAPPEAMARELAGALPQGRLALLETGHFPYVEDPTALLAAVTTFLTAVRR
ncbi:MAG: alpha/beta fold hydrolase [Longimicrobiales bacterium]